MRLFALCLILLATLWRVLGVYVPELGNFAPMMALAFCAGAYFQSWSMWILPFAVLGLTDLYVDHYYALAFHYALPIGEWAIRLLCFAAGLGFGRLTARRRSWISLLNGILSSSLLFYVVTNTVSWYGDLGYSHDAAGWWQAMTIGHPQFAPTLYFFRNTFTSDLLFTAAFALAMEFAAARRGEFSLIRSAGQRS